ncbi:hypothetical protein HMPREF1581_00428 [Gardnerella vaginalis JCP8108]|uniref:Uncharacterized protein n=1 Tax=Gardnerella vaginalis JCP8108 TaxID=1261066 RepID=S4GTL9_GARVA|nr:hypothetical protein HMPREF1581_00428 [Gardnerella vaginalis JCP8108]
MSCCYFINTKNELPDFLINVVKGCFWRVALVLKGNWHINIIHIFFYYALIVIIFESFSSFIKNRLQY